MSKKVINFGARIVSGLGRRDHITPVLKELGWNTVDEMLCERDIAAMRRLPSPSCEADTLRQWRSQSSGKGGEVGHEGPPGGVGPPLQKI